MEKLEEKKSESDIKKGPLTVNVQTKHSMMSFDQINSMADKKEKEDPLKDKNAHKKFMDAISYGKNLDWSTDDKVR